MRYCDLVLLSVYFVLHADLSDRHLQAVPERPLVLGIHSHAVCSGSVCVCVCAGATTAVPEALFVCALIHTICVTHMSHHCVCVCVVCVCVCAGATTAGPEARAMLCSDSKYLCYVHRPPLLCLTLCALRLSVLCCALIHMTSLRAGVTTTVQEPAKPCRASSVSSTTQTCEMQSSCGNVTVP